LVQFNSQKREILLKIVYYGAGLSGKTTNLKYLHKIIAGKTETELFSVNTMEDRTLFFDLMPIDLEAAGRKIKFQIYTVPGQVHYDSTRRIILAGADGVIFIADSDSDKMKDNVESLNNLYKNLNANRLDIKTIPIAFQYNKRDLPNITPLNLIDRKLNFREAPNFPAVATKGEGVIETFKSIAIDVVRHVVTKYKLVRKEEEVNSIIADVEKSLNERLKVNKNSIEDIPNEDDKTKIIYEGEDGHVSESEILEKALNATEKTATLLNETKILKQKLEKKNKEQALLLKENTYMKNFLQSLFHHAGLPIFSFSIKGKITNWNSLCEKLLSYKTKEVKGMYFSELIPEKHLLDVQTTLSSVISSKSPMSTFVTLVNKFDVGKTYNCIFSPVADDKNNVISISVIIHYTDSTLNKEVTVNESNVKSIKELINKVINNFSTILVNNNIILKNNIFEDNRSVEISEHILYKIVNSLLRNSLKSFDDNSPKKEIAITLNTSDKEAYILNIRDTGKGFTKEHLESLFNNSSIIESDSLDDNFTISECKFLMEKNEGDLKIISKEGKGAIVSLILPQNKENSKNEVIEGKLNKIFQGKSILLLDKREGDELKNFSFNFKMDKAKYGNEGVLLVNKNKYDYIVVDFHIPEFSGYQFFDWVLDEKPYLSEYLIFIIENKKDEDIMKFLKENDLKFIERPVTADKLIKVVE